MAFTGQNVMASVANRAHKDISTAGSDADTDVKEWVKQAILHVQKANDWKCHKTTWSLTTATTPALAAGTYSYNMRTLVTNFRKLCGDSVRYGTHRLAWAENIEDIDDQLGPQWKDAGQSGGGPDHCTMLGNSLVVGPNLSSSWITSYGTAGLAGYCFVGEDVWTADWEDDNLLFGDDFFMDLVEVALIFGLQTEDNPDWQTMLQMWEQVGLTRLRGYDEVPLVNEQVRGPRRYRGRIA